VHEFSGITINNGEKDRFWTGFRELILADRPFILLILSSFAKSRERRRYDNAQRISERAVVKRRLMAEMGRARAWLDSHTAALDIPQRLVNPLTGEGPLLLKEL